MEFLDPIIDFLGERQGLRRNWQYVFGVVVSIMGALAAREYARKWRKLKGDHDGRLLTKPLTATVISTEKQGEIRYDAEITAVDDGYRVTIVKEGGLCPGQIVDHSLASLDDVERFLRANTKFILADFR